MALFGSDDSSKAKNAPMFTKPVDPGWVFPPEGGFFPFLDLDPEAYNLGGAGGVFLIWHAGVHPEWVYAGGHKRLSCSAARGGHKP